MQPDLVWREIDAGLKNGYTSNMGMGRLERKPSCRGSAQSPENMPLSTVDPFIQVSHTDILECEP